MSMQSMMEGEGGGGRIWRVKNHSLYQATTAGGRDISLTKCGQCKRKMGIDSEESTLQ